MQGMELKNDLVTVQKILNKKIKYQYILSKGDIYNNRPSVLLEISLEEEHVEYKNLIEVHCDSEFRVL
jgi:hypothetical protein